MARALLSKRLGRLIAQVPRLRTLVWVLEAMLLGALWMLSYCLTPAAASRFGSLLMAAVGPLLGRNRTLLANLKVMFPEHTDEQHRRLARKVWGNFGAMLAEYPHLRFITRARVEIRISDAARGVVEGREPALYMAAHLANFEIVPACIVRLGVPLSVIYSPQQNPLVDRMIQYHRRPNGCEFITKREAFQEMIQALQKGRSIGVLPDQRADAGPALPFFGRDAVTAVIPARLAHRVGCPVVPIRVERLPGCWFRVTFDDPIDIHSELKGKEASLKTTSEYLTRLEGWIRIHPEQWLALKRRWPKQKQAAAVEDEASRSTSEASRSTAQSTLEIPRSTTA